MNAILNQWSLWLAALVWDATWKSAVLLAAAGALGLAIRRSSAAARHLVWSLAMAGSLALPVVALSMPSWSWPILPTEVSVLSLPVAPTPIHIVPPGTLVQEFTAEADRDRPKTSREDPKKITRSAPAPGIVDTPTSPAASKNAARPPVGWLVIVWATGVMWILAIPLVGRLALLPIVRSAGSSDARVWRDLAHQLAGQLGLRRVRFLRSDRAVMPMTWGLLRPVILLPGEADGWPRDRLHDVLLHELAHVRRLDCLTQVIAQVSCALYWFNPLAWLASRQMRKERERACDDVVLRAGARPSDYAGHLLEIARGLRSARAVSFAALSMARPSQLEGRVLSVLDPSRRRSGLSRTVVGLGVIASVAMILPLASIRLGVHAAEPVSTREHTEAFATLAADPQLDGRSTVSGIVSDTLGKPIAGAKVAVVAELRTPTGDPGNPTRKQVLGSTRTGTEGRFRIEFAPLSERVHPLTVVGGGAGWGLSHRSINSADLSQEANITLDREQIIHGRFVDIQGQPIPGVTTLVVAVGNDYRGDWSYTAVGDAPPWPSPVTSDQDGRFKLSGLSPLEAIWLEASSDKTARAHSKIEAGHEGRTKEKLIALAPAQALDVRVTREDTSKPMLGAAVNVTAVRRSTNRGPFRWLTTQSTDDQGRALVNPYEGDMFRIAVNPSAGEPYLPSRLQVNWSKGAVRQTVEIKLKPGIAVRGTIIEETSDKPVSGARVAYLRPRRGNESPSVYRDGAYPTVTGTDGKFTIVVPPGLGHLLVRGPTDDFLHLQTNNLELGVPSLPIFPLYPDAIAHVDLKLDEKTHEVAMRLRRGVTVRGRVIGPDGTAIAKAFAIGRSYVPRLNALPVDHFSGSAPEIPVRDGRFEIPGCNPEKPYTFFLVDLEHQLGTKVELTGKPLGPVPVTVQLQKCGAATFQWKDREGKPVATQEAGSLLKLIMTPGADIFTREKIMADFVYQANLDWERLGRKLRTDAEGRATFVSLIPGATYRIHDREFIAEAGKTLNLGDIVMEKPTRP
jgi:beta-lactamase regulating signal transducer with metallopeptidase domain